MKLEENGDYFVMDSGRRFYAHGGVIGCGVFSDWDDNDTPVELVSASYGWDGGIDYEGFTPEERKELADYAIGLWQRFAEGK